MNKELDEYIDSIRKAMNRESATSPKSKEKHSPSDILIAAREMMKRAKDARSNKSNR